MFNTSGVQTLASAYVFGSAGLVFALLPFLFMVLRGIMKANDHNTRHTSIFGVFAFAFVVHIVSCIFFMTSMKILNLTAPMKEKDYFTGKVFGVFWAKDKDSAFSLAGASSGAEADGAYAILYSVQLVRDFSFIVLPIFCVFLGFAYGFLQSKKDVYKTDVIKSVVWSAVGACVAFILFMVWAKIANLTMFLPTGDIILFIREQWGEILKV